jgi:hypothetical protein
MGLAKRIKDEAEAGDSDNSLREGQPCESGCVGGALVAIVKHSGRA